MATNNKSSTSSVTTISSNPYWTSTGLPAVVTANGITVHNNTINGYSLSQLYCSECADPFEGGLGGAPAQSHNEAVVAAYANGWFIGKNLTVCLDCRKKITPDNVDEDLLQDNQ